ncbi:MAG: DivIVA domain-containing protein, partial [Proteobacteria bacterium]|nr:DivIVA domain-containing protein [Pseudomonadota bacterium]
GRKVALLKEQNADLRKEEVDFKSTLASAQRFAEDLKEKSRTEAAEMIAGAHAEINKIRDDAQAELERLPREVEALMKKRGEVKKELKGILETYLETLDVFYPEEKEELATATEYDVELFQKVEIGEDGFLNAKDLERIQMDFESPLSSGAVDEEALATLLGDNRDAGDDLDLKKMFNLDLNEEDKDNGSS